MKVYINKHILSENSKLESITVVAEVHYSGLTKLFLKTATISYNIMEMSLPQSKLNLVLFLHYD